MLPAHSFELDCQRFRQRKGMDASAKTLNRWSLSIGGKFQQRRNLRELTFPVGELRVQPVRLELFSLPDSKVGILSIEIGKGAWRAPGKTVVKQRQLASEDCGGPAIENDVMKNQRKDKRIGLQLHQRDSE